MHGILTLSPRDAFDEAAIPGGKYVRKSHAVAQKPVLLQGFPTPTPADAFVSAAPGGGCASDKHAIARKAA